MRNRRGFLGTVVAGAAGTQGHAVSHCLNDEQRRQLSFCGRLHVTKRKAVRTTGPSNSRDKVRAHRKRLRRRGLRPIQIWVPDVRSRAFSREAHRQSLLVANHLREREDQDFVDAISDGNAE